MQPVRNDLADCYFEYSPQQQQQYRMADSSPVSPSTSIEHPQSTAQERPHPERFPRAISDHIGLQPRVRIQTIIEDNTALPARLPIRRGRDLLRSNDNGTDTAQSLVEPNPSPQPFRPVTPIEAPRPQSMTELRGPISAVRRSNQVKPRQSWRRTQSGGVWYRRPASSDTHGSQSSSKSKTYTPAVYPAVTPGPQSPLVPPERPASDRGPQYNHKIVVETEFTQPEPPHAKDAHKNPEPTPLTSQSRKSSINPLVIFSAPLTLVRRFNLPKRARQSRSNSGWSPADNQKDPHMLDHPSLLKKNHTTTALYRVASILQDLPHGVRAALPAAVGRPPQSQAKTPGYASRMIKGIMAPMTLHSQNSNENIPASAASYTSSQHDLRMGVQPNNTPDESATYKVKRSPSAATEEFLKVDISVRGGTSYLPSEARRIHTPPLPEKGANGPRRGFFFDYNAPEMAEITLGLGTEGSVSGIGMLDNLQTSEPPFGGVPTIGKKEYSPARLRKLVRAQTGDWYDAKLAQLDLDETSGGRDFAEKLSFLSSHSNSRPAQTTTTSMTSMANEIRPHEEGDEQELNIPEHLPSSPLCPRHPRYWRVTKARKQGKDFDGSRGCWMHGVGPVDEV